MTRRRLIGLAVLGLAAGLGALKWEWDRSGRLLMLLDPVLARSQPCDEGTQAGSRFIAHAGGAVGALTYTNSLEALESAWGAGCRWFEIDFDWTADHHLVAHHDWNDASARVFGSPGHQMTRQEFLSTPRLDGLTSLDTDRLAAWLESHPGARIVTDVKWKPVDGAAYLLRTIPDATTRLIPQAYDWDELPRLHALGFSEPILTTYRRRFTDDELIERGGREAILAVTIPAARASTTLLRRLDAAGVAVFAHTANSRPVARSLRRRGVQAVYTDRLCGCPGGIRGAAGPTPNQEPGSTSSRSTRFLPAAFAR